MPWRLRSIAMAVQDGDDSGIFRFKVHSHRQGDAWRVRRTYYAMAPSETIDFDIDGAIVDLSQAILLPSSTQGIVFKNTRYATLLSIPRSLGPITCLEH